MYQTTPNQVFFIAGSATIGVQSSVASTSYTNLGAAQGIKITEAWTLVEQETLSMQPHYSPYKQEVILEVDLMEYDFLKLYTMRGGIDSYSTTSEKTFTSGGLSSMNSMAWQVVNTGPTSSQSITITIPYGHISEVFSIPFQSDDAAEVAKLHIVVRGVCQTTATAGSMLYSIIDTRTT